MSMGTLEIFQEAPIIALLDLPLLQLMPIALIVHQEDQSKAIEGLEVR